MPREPKLRLLEHYYSVQGEGPRVGIPTQFVRFAGCNLRCPLWPCDTQYAIQPKLFEAEQRLVGAAELADEVCSMALKTGARNVCLTGGEPMLQTKVELNILINELRSAGLTLEMFSNGTIEYWPLVFTQVSIVMDWKLPGSGETGKREDVVLSNLEILRRLSNHSIKFTVIDQGDLIAAKQRWDLFNLRDAYCPIFVAPVWSKIDPAEVVDFLRFNQLPWRLNLQTHKFIWSPEARGI
jgi:7-carboxy-7-deazaguanine synthase